MSYYPTMLQPVEDHRQYLLQVNKFGEAVCYLIDAEGKATSFVTGMAPNVIGEPLRQATDGLLWVARRPGYDFGDGLRDSPDFWGFPYDVDTWAALAAVLNGKSGVRRARCESALRVLRRVDSPIDEFIRDGDDGTYVLGPRGEASDQRGTS